MNPLIFSTLLLAQTPPELGDVQWLRHFPQALEQAKKLDRPVLVLFDEVPGCQTCVRYGESVLRHPLLVEAAETLFIPVAIYNNVGGADREVLKRYKEPTWNNPVVRFLDASGEDIAPRLAGDYRLDTLATRMLTALKKTRKETPRWLQTVAEESGSTTRVYLGMHCFWSGEACLGQDTHVLASRTGWMNGGEVVEIEVKQGHADEVIRRAWKQGCARKLHTNKTELAASGKALGFAVSPPGRFRPTPKDDLHTLRQTPWAALPLSPLQALRVNALLHRRQSFAAWLSPRQQTLAQKIRNTRDLPDATQASDMVVAQSRLLTALKKQGYSLSPKSPR